MAEINHGFTAKQIIDEGRTTEEDIQHVKTWLSTQNLPNLTDEQIVVFLLSCDNHHKSTKATVRAFYSVRSKTPEIFNNRNLHRSDLLKNFTVAQVCELPERTDDGCAIIISRLCDTNYRNANIRAYLTNVCMATDAALYNHPPKGLIILYDIKGMGIMHLTTIKLGLFRAYIQYLQESLPVKLKNMHVLNCYSIFDKVMALAKPFLKKEVVEKIKFHPVGVDMELFYKNWIPRRCLPEDYGGDLPSMQILQENHIHKINNMQSYFDTEEQQRYTIAK